MTTVSEDMQRAWNETVGVQRSLGREPRDFADYARETASSGVWVVSALVGTARSGCAQGRPWAVGFPHCPVATEAMLACATCRDLKGCAHLGQVSTRRS